MNNTLLNGKSKLALEYHNISYAMMKNRIISKMDLYGDDRSEEKFTDALDEIWNLANEEELKEIESLPRLWWFQYSKDGYVQNISELTVYPYAQYFVAQEPLLLGDDVSLMKGKPYFGDKLYYPHDPVFYLGIIKEDENTELVTMTNRHYDELQDNYQFIRYINEKMPIFQKVSK